MSAPVVGGNARRAALALHALVEADRQWVLQAMPAHHRDQLVPLLDELRELGIPPDPMAVEESLRLAASPEQGLHHASDRDPLSPPQARHLARWLADEPAAVAARLLRACPAWRDRLLEAHPRRQRTEMMTLAAQLPQAAALDRFVAGAALEQLRSAVAGEPKGGWRWLQVRLAARGQR